MLRALLLLFAALSALLGLLTVVTVPRGLDWRTALLAGEYGQWVALAALATAIGAVALREGRPAWTAATVALGLAGAGLLLKPAFQAWRIGRHLPAQLERAFGAAPRGPVFSLARLYSLGPRRLAPETLAYARGLELDFYRPAGAAPAPCVVVIHSGGWDNGDRRELPGFDAWLVGRGCAVAAIDYRLAPAALWPAPREDVRAAVSYLRAHAGRLGLDPGRIVLFGRSAGGQIAEATAYALPGLDLRGVIAFYAPADLKFAYDFGREDDILHSLHLLRQYLGGTPASAPAAYAEASAVTLVAPGGPPTLLMHGELDPLVWHRQSERLEAKLAAAGVPHLFVSLPWATHAFEYNLNGPGGQLATAAVGAFLDSAFR